MAEIPQYANALPWNSWIFTAPWERRRPRRLAVANARDLRINQIATAV
jgi:hypothetical protein